MKTAERLNHDQFDLLCRAADIGGLATLEELSDVLEGEANHLPRAEVAARYLIQEGFLQKIGELYRITRAGKKSLR